LGICTVLAAIHSFDALFGFSSNSRLAGGQGRRKGAGVIEDLVCAAADAWDDLLMSIQRLFCRHRPMTIPNYAILCKKCGKHLKELANA